MANTKTIKSFDCAFAPVLYFYRFMELQELPKQHYSEKEKTEVFNGEFMPHIHSMYNFAYRLTLERDDAKDLVQDTYLKAYRFIESFQKGFACMGIRQNVGKPMSMSSSKSPGAHHLNPCRLKVEALII